MPTLRSTQYHSSRHLGAADLLEPQERCPICLADGERRAVHRLQEDPPVDFLHCSSCGACSAERMPTPELLQRYYGEYYEGSDEMATFYDVDRLAAHVWSSIDPDLLGATLRILDFGGGEGLLAQRVAELFRRARGSAARSEIVLVDYQESPPCEGDGWSQRQVRTLEEVPGPFDLVLASSILEHVPDLHEVLRGLFERVARPGYFYARTPYIESFLRLSSKVDVTFPGHVHDMGDRFWNRVPRTFALEGVRVAASRPSPVETRFRQAPLRTLAAHVLKFPAHLERWFLGSVERRMRWTLVGGWEILLLFEDRGGPHG